MVLCAVRSLSLHRPQYLGINIASRAIIAHHCSWCSAGAAVPVPTEDQMLDTLVFKDGPSQSLYH